MKPTNEFITSELSKKITDLGSAFNLYKQLNKCEEVDYINPFMSDKGFDWYFNLTGFYNNVYFAICVYSLNGKITLEVPCTNDFNLLSIKF